MFFKVQLNNQDDPKALWRVFIFWSDLFRGIRSPGFPATRATCQLTINQPKSKAKNGTHTHHASILLFPTAIMQQSFMSWHCILLSVQLRYWLGRGQWYGQTWILCRIHNIMSTIQMLRNCTSSHSFCSKHQMDSNRSMGNLHSYWEVPERMIAHTAQISPLSRMVVWMPSRLNFKLLWPKQTLKAAATALTTATPHRISIIHLPILYNRPRHHIELANTPYLIF